MLDSDTEDRNCRGCGTSKIKKKEKEIDKYTSLANKVHPPLPSPIHQIMPGAGALVVEEYLAYEFQARPLAEIAAVAHVQSLAEVDLVVAVGVLVDEVAALFAGSDLASCHAPLLFLPALLAQPAAPRPPGPRPPGVLALEEALHLSALLRRPLNIT